MDILQGKITKDDLYREFPVFQEKAEGRSFPVLIPPLLQYAITP
jgi:hypothetical protein